MDTISLYEDDYVWILQTIAQGAEDGAYIEDIDDVSSSFGGNIALHVLDDSKTVLQRRIDVLQKIYQHTHAAHIFWLNQVHKNDCVRYTHLGALTCADAVISDKRGALAIVTADCVPIALFSQHGALTACIHAGWQGLCQGVIANTCQQLHSMQRTKNAPIYAVIGACISQKYYEMPKSLAQKIVKTSMHHGFIADNKNTYYVDGMVDDCVASSNAHNANNEAINRTEPKVHFDLFALACAQLKKQGAIIINDTAPCTYADTRFFSHRRITHKQKPTTGRTALLIVKKC